MEDVCGCKGVRSCLICEAKKQIISDFKERNKECVSTFTYCHECEKAWSHIRHHPNHEGDSLDFPGITLIDDFVTADEEQWLDEEINKTSWSNSQSGRRKQDYGPKVNFKRKKLKPATFTGLPNFSKILVERMQKHEILEDFIPIELCNLEYIPARGSAIDPHFDDIWIWGKRLVTINLLSETVYTMTIDCKPDTIVAIPFVPRSLIVMYGPARYQWKHSIDRNDIHKRRLALTFRELTPEFLRGGAQENIGDELIRTAMTYEGVAVGSTSSNESACK